MPNRVRLACSIGSYGLTFEQQRRGLVGQTVMKAESDSVYSQSSLGLEAVKGLKRELQRTSVNVCKIERLFCAARRRVHSFQGL